MVAWSDICWRYMWWIMIQMGERWYSLHSEVRFSWNINQNYIIFTCGMIVTYKYICILALTTLKMARWVAETCQWSLCNKIMFIKPKCIWWLFKINFMLLQVFPNSLSQMAAKGLDWFNLQNKWGSVLWHGWCG